MKFTYAMTPFRTRFDIFLAPAVGRCGHQTCTISAVLVLKLRSSTSLK